ncbi:MAG TPA: hypothetical protein VNZ49_07940 [Bacteroidia bacterium]|nr:hypothetical protein [Bacteroidia bacterium]
MSQDSHHQESPKRVYFGIPIAFALTFWFVVFLCLKACDGPKEQGCCKEGGECTKECMEKCKAEGKECAKACEEKMEGKAEEKKAESAAEEKKESVTEEKKEGEVKEGEKPTEEKKEAGGHH